MVQTLSIDQIRELISPERRHQEYLISEYVDYCRRIRSALEPLSRDEATRDIGTFFEKKFVEEMEVIARICKHQFGRKAQGHKVQYVEKDPPDGIIRLANGKQIFIECTSARDSQWENFVLEQMRKFGRIISLSGFEGADIEGNRAKGYKVKGIDIEDQQMQEYLVEADEDMDVMARHRRQIVDKIEKKIRKNWEARSNWLSIFVNEFVMPGGYTCMQPILNELCQEYKHKLLAKHIEALYLLAIAVTTKDGSAFIQ